MINASVVTTCAMTANCRFEECDHPNNLEDSVLNGIRAVSFASFISSTERSTEMNCGHYDRPENSSRAFQLVLIATIAARCIQRRWMDERAPRIEGNRSWDRGLAHFLAASESVRLVETPWISISRENVPVPFSSDCEQLQIDGLFFRQSVASRQDELERQGG